MRESDVVRGSHGVLVQYFIVSEPLGGSGDPREGKKDRGEEESDKRVRQKPYSGDLSMWTSVVVIYL